MFPQTRSWSKRFPGFLDFYVTYYLLINMLLLVEIIIIMKGWIITLCCVTSLCFSGIFKKFMFSELKKSALV